MSYNPLFPSIFGFDSESTSVGVVLGRQIGIMTGRVVGAIGEGDPTEVSGFADVLWATGEYEVDPLDNYILTIRGI